MATRSAAPHAVMSALVLTGLSASAVALALAPLLMPASYSVVANTTSESAAQGVEGAWLARLGFLLFGLSVEGLAIAARHRWGALPASLHYTFGALLTAAAAFSTRPATGAPFDHTEDILHSVAATTMGFAFVGGVIATTVHRARKAPRGSTARAWVIDATAVVTSTAVPAAMVVFPAVGGALQRIMFAVAYAWYALMAVGLLRRGPRPATGQARAARPQAATAHTSVAQHDWPDTPDGPRQWPLPAA